MKLAVHLIINNDTDRESVLGLTTIAIGNETDEHFLIY